MSRQHSSFVLASSVFSRKEKCRFCGVMNWCPHVRQHYCVLFSLFLSFTFLICFSVASFYFAFIAFSLQLLPCFVFVFLPLPSSPPLLFLGIFLLLHLTFYFLNLALVDVKFVRSIYLCNVTKFAVKPAKVFYDIIVSVPALRTSAL